MLRVVWVLRVVCQGCCSVARECRLLKGFWKPVLVFHFVI